MKTITAALIALAIVALAGCASGPDTISAEDRREIQRGGSTTCVGSTVPTWCM